MDSGLNSTNAGKVVAICLIVVVGVAVSEVDDPGVVSIVGDRRRRPEWHLTYYAPLRNTTTGHHWSGTKVATINRQQSFIEIDSTKSLLAGLDASKSMLSRKKLLHCQLFKKIPPYN